MGYVERSLGPRPRPTLTIDSVQRRLPGEVRPFPCSYDIDSVGLDDGLDSGGRPSGDYLRLRLLFGQGITWMFVVGQPVSSSWDHALWFIDPPSDPEEEVQGRPRARCAPFVLPPLYAGVVVEPAGAPPRRLGLVGATFEADVELGGPWGAELRLALRGPDSSPAELVWTGGPGSGGTWRLQEGAGDHDLVPGERVAFVDPLVR